jgi:hypothetical protein
VFYLLPSSYYSWSSSAKSGADLLKSNYSHISSKGLKFEITPKLKPNYNPK